MGFVVGNQALQNMVNCAFINYKKSYYIEIY